MTLIGTDIRPRCKRCGKLLAESVTRPWTIGCGRCKTVCTSNDLEPSDVAKPLEIELSDMVAQWIDSGEK